MKNYDHPLEQEDGSTIPCKVNEYTCMLGATNGNRKPCAAGIRLMNTKCMMVVHDEDTNTAYVTMQGGGGAVISKTNKALVMGIWSKFSNSSAGPQTQGGCADTVERVAKFMREQNF